MIITKELLETVLAIISVLLVIGVAVFLYSNYVSNKELEEAKASLNFLVNQASNDATEVVIYNPDKWGGLVIKNSVWILSFSSSKRQQIPEFCAGKRWNNCICICAKALSVSARTSCLTPNNNKITCLESDFSIEEEIKNPPITLFIDPENKIIFTKEFKQNEQEREIEETCEDCGKDGKGCTQKECEDLSIEIEKKYGDRYCVFESGNKCRTYKKSG